MTGLWKKNAALEDVDKDADKKIDDAVGKCCDIICMSWRMFDHVSCYKPIIKYLWDAEVKQWKPFNAEKRQ